MKSERIEKTKINECVIEPQLRKSSIKYSRLEQSEKKLFLNSRKCEQIINVLTQKEFFDRSLPISIELHLTNRCNLLCEWCVDKSIRKNNLDLPYEAAMDFLNDICGKHIGLTIEGGGEPTIYPYFYEFVKEAQKKFVDIGLITNGVKRIEADLIPSFKWIRVSVDSTNPDEYILEKGINRFDAVIKNVEYLCKNKGNCFVGVGYVLTNRNYKNILDFIQRLDCIGIDYIQIRPVEEQAGLMLSEETLFDLKQRIDKLKQGCEIQIEFRDKKTVRLNNSGFPCIAHSLRSIIHADGNVLLCEKRRHDPLTLGNIKEQTFTDIWNSDMRCEYTQKLLDPSSQIGCTECRITKFNQLFCELIDLKTINFI